MTLATSGANSTDPAVDPVGLERIATLTEALKAAITEATGAKRVSVILHAHHIPAERYHRINRPVDLSTDADGRPVMTSKHIGGLSLHCDHQTLARPSVASPERPECPDLTAAIVAFEASAEGCA